MAVARFEWHTLAGVWPETRAWHLPELAEAAFRKGTGNGVVPELIEKAHDEDQEKKNSEIYAKKRRAYANTAQSKATKCKRVSFVKWGRVFKEEEKVKGRASLVVSWPLI